METITYILSIYFIVFLALFVSDILLCAYKFKGFKRLPYWLMLRLSLYWPINLFYLIIGKSYVKNEDFYKAMQKIEGE
jgi:hypothetical protein